MALPSGPPKASHFEAPDLDFAPRAAKPAAPTVVGRAAPAPGADLFDDDMEVERGGGHPMTPPQAAPPARAAAPPQPPPARPPPGAVAAPAPSAGQGVKVPFAGANTGRVIDDPFDDASEGGELKLELDIQRASKQPPARNSGVPGAPAGAATSARPGAVPVGMPTSHVSHRPPAMGAPAPVAPSIEEQILREQASAIAAFGDPPRRFWETPLYAWKVRVRQGELRKELEARRNEAQQAATQLEDALVAFAERVRPIAEATSFYLRAFDPIRALEQQVRSLDGALAAESDAHKERMREIEARVTQAEQVLSQLQLEERRLADDLAQAEAALQRAEAKLKRVDIELRGAQVPSSQRRI